MLIVPSGFLCSVQESWLNSMNNEGCMMARLMVEVVLFQLWWRNKDESMTAEAYDAFVRWQRNENLQNKNWCRRVQSAAQQREIS